MPPRQAVLHRLQRGATVPRRPLLPHKHRDRKVPRETLLHAQLLGGAVLLARGILRRRHQLHVPRGAFLQPRQHQAHAVRVFRALPAGLGVPRLAPRGRGRPCVGPAGRRRRAEGSGAALAPGGLRNGHRADLGIRVGPPDGCTARDLPATELGHGFELGARLRLQAALHRDPVPHGGFFCVLLRPPRVPADGRFVVAIFFRRSHVRSRRPRVHPVSRGLVRVAVLGRCAVRLQGRLGCLGARRLLGVSRRHAQRGARSRVPRPLGPGPAPARATAVRRAGGYLGFCFRRHMDC
mmetsp:Transcript_42639/g.128848  ORF Transcript_42639/g.128848 Transcript_42639/m.128848 type:complete len:294 (-) Transcript_42639:112-993(-)